MASLEKLIKALEAIKVLETDAAGADSKKKEQPLSKKEKIINCNSIADCMCALPLRNIGEFPKFLGIAVETFLMLCDDSESDVRMMADECLNRTIKTLLETNLGRVQVELYKEIKKNGFARSLRAALWRFADLCHLIRPQKCRPYVVNLLPCLTRVCRRPEEAVQETLATAMNKICPVLMSFTTDSEIKALLKGFLPNLSSSSAATRRTAASSLALMCQYCRKPQTFTSFLLTALLDLVLPVDEDKNVYLILGVLLALRHIIPQLTQLEEQSQRQNDKQLLGNKVKEVEVMVETHQLIQLYELLLYNVDHKDHNVVTSALETLQQLLKTTPPRLLHFLLQERQLSSTTILKKDMSAANSVSDDSRSRLSSVNDEATLDEDAEFVTDVTLDTQTGEEDKPGEGEITSQDLDMEVFDQDIRGPQTESEGVETTVSPVSDAEGVTDIVQGDCTTGTDRMQTSITTDSDYTNIEIGDVCDDRAISQSSSMDTLSEAKSSVKSHLPKLKKYASEDTLSTHSNEDFPEITASIENLTEDIQTNGKVRDGDIGSVTTPEPPLLYCCRLLCSKFLLTGYKDGLISDKQVRVSVKTLALSCTGSILLLYPDVFLMRLHKCSPVPGDLQDIQDVLQYASHSDPQLKSTTAVLVGNLIYAALRISKGSIDSWLKQHSYTGDISIQGLTTLLILLLEDDSSVVCRQTLVSLKTCLVLLLNSSHSDLGLKVILALLHLKDNSYWLVKVELLELLGSIDFKVVEYLENLCEDLCKGQNHFLGRWCVQDYVLNNIFMNLLGDENIKVKHAAAMALVKIIPKLFFPVDHPQNDAIVAKAKDFITEYLDPIMHDWCHSVEGQIPGLVEPYNCSLVTQTSFTVEAALSRVVAMVVDCMLTSTSKHLTCGCCHALCLLSAQYHVTQYASAWCCAPGCIQPYPTGSASTQKLNTPGASTSVPILLSSISVEDLPKGSGGGTLSIVLSLLMASPLAFDLATHQDALQLAGNLFAGAAYKSMRSPEEAASSGSDSVRWTCVSDRLLVPFADQLLTHVTRVLNICAHIIDDQTPGPPQTKTSLPSLPNAPSLSPIKRKARGLKDDAGGVQPVSPSQDKSSHAGAKETAKDSDRDKVKSKEGLGAFYNIPHYMKLYEVLKGAFSNYMITLDMTSSEKFISMLRTTLKVLAQLFEVAGIPEVGKHAEEILNYLKATVSMEGTTSVLCVQQLLKALFGTNLSSQWETSHNTGGSRKPGKATRLSSNVHPGLYHCCFTTPYTQFTQCLASATFRSTTHAEHDDSYNMVQWLKKRAEKRIPAIMKPGSKTDKASVAAFIRLFEPLVIKALKQYTITSCLALQQQVLNLLAQLVQLRVNYCLLDSDQIFIGFVIKQFEIIEEGQIRKSEKLIPHIFNFLVLLSYERYHSKSVIAMPKVIQLCDGILASGLDPQAHAIPALRCIVHDLFILRTVNKADSGKDVDTQREFVVSMLLRLIRYYEVLELLILVLYQCRKDGEDNWKRLSRQVTDTVLPLLAKQEMNLDSQEAMDVVHRLFESVTPSVFRPVDLLLQTLFTIPSNLSDIVCMQRWLAQLMIILRVLLNQSKEEMVLSRLQELGLEVCLLKDTTQKHREAQRSSPTPGSPGDTPGSPSHTGLMFNTAEETMARYLLQVVGVVVHEISCRASDVTGDKASYKLICQELSHFMLYVTHMFQSGVYRKVANFAISMIKHSPLPNFWSINEIDSAFKDIASLEPTLTLQWCNILILLNYEDQSWWSAVLQTRKFHMGSPSDSQGSLQEKLSPNKHAINTEVVRRGGLILFCDYVCENLNDAEHVTWVLINHVNDLIMLSHEPPVQDFISAIHRNSAASGLFIQAIHSRCEHLPKPSLVKKTLQCLESIPLSQSGALLTLLIDKFLRTHHLAVSRGCDTIACRRLEMLLADNMDESINQLPLEDLEKLLQFMKSSGLTKRHRRLASLLNKHRTQLCPESMLTLSPEKTHPLALNTSNVMDITIDKTWYISIVRDQCFSPNADPQQCAQLLQHMDYTSILNIIMAKECSLSILEECISLGTSRTLSTIKQIQQNSQVKDQFLLSKETASPENVPDPLLQASQLTLFRHLNNIINLLPVPHQLMTYEVGGDSTDDQYNERMEDLFSDGPWVEAVFLLTQALQKYLGSLPSLPWEPALPAESVHDIARFSILGLEVLHWMLHHDQPPTSDQQETVMSSLSATLQQPQLHSVISQRDRVTWVFSAIRTVHQLLSSLLVLPGHSLVALPHQDSQEDSNLPGFDDMHHAVRACDQISELIHCLRTHLCQPQPHQMLPQTLVPTLRNVVIGLARLPLVNSYARTPPLVWKLGWLPSPTGAMRTCLPPLPLDYLQEKEVLKEFIYRVNTLGWTSRQQFEETWMSLLGVLNPIHLAEESLPTAEDIDRCQCAVMATRCITSLLVQSSLTPTSGNPNNSTLEYKPRNKALAFLNTKVGQKLVHVRGMVEHEVRAMVITRKDSRTRKEWGKDKHLLVDNLERTSQTDEFSMGQMSVEWIWSLLGMLDEPSREKQTDSDSQSDSTTPGDSPSADSIYPPLAKLSLSPDTAQRSSVQSGLDIHSCLQFLLELFKQLLAQNTTPRTPLMQLNETVKAVVALSDLFTEKAQYEWLLETLLEVHRTNTTEDELVTQYVVTGVCKAAAVVGMELAIQERVLKLVESCIKSTHLPTKISALHGSLYILETGATEVTVPLINTLTEYLYRTLGSITHTTIHSLNHVLVMWTVVFYILENCVDEIKDADFASKTLQLCVSAVSAHEDVIPLPVHLTILRGLERLLLADILTKADASLLLKLSVDRLCLSSPQRALGALGLLLSCLYSGKQGDQWTPTQVILQPEFSLAERISQDPESLISAMERVTVLFDRIRKGLPYEARVIARILPPFLADFFPPQDIMNKVIGEFLSNQQPHPQLMASVVFGVFGQLLQTKQQEMIQDWVMLSLSNFTQRSPVAMAVWSLTCFFLSASTNSWLRALLPHVLSRMGKMDDIDHKLFCISAIDFWNGLKDSSQKRAFLSTFQGVSKPDTPYSQLVLCLA